MAVVLLIAAVAIIVGAVVVALGRGGELAHFPADLPRWDAELGTAADVAMLRPPSALFGYSPQATDDALGQIAQLITERDVEIAALRSRVAELQQQLEELAGRGSATAPGPAAPGPAAAQGRLPGRAAQRPPAAPRPSVPERPAAA
ncbi:MAG: hypothetical protein ACLQI7_15735, partial [Streptosporangiaceae bacterium]